MADGFAHLQPRRRLAHHDLRRWALEQGVGSATELWRWCDRPAWLMHIAAGAMPFADAAIGVCSVAHVVDGFAAPATPTTAPPPSRPRLIGGYDSWRAEPPHETAKRHESLWRAAHRRASEASAAFAGAAPQGYVVMAAVAWCSAEEKLYTLAHHLAQAELDDDDATAELMRIGRATRDQRGELCDAIRSSPFFAEEVVIEGLLRADLQVLEGYRPRWRRQ